ncbi:MAG: hypothetical protein BWX50_00649 [Euryarchaeota archaeon ADurb.Bin009]|nr:MAG: hypothetical protein BWX50_00649 [Euryarchaeota archaeon ADurb.Bin009]
MEGPDHLDLGAVEAVLLPVVHPAGDDPGCPLVQLLLDAVHVPVELALVELHQLDDLQDEVPLRPDERHEVVQFILVDALKEHHIQLDRGQADLDRRIDAGKDIREAIFPRDGRITLGAERIEADVHPGKPRLLERRSLFGKERPVRRHRGLDARRHGADDIDEVTAEQGFSAGELDALDTELHAHLHQLGDIRSAHLLSWVHLALGMTVDAPQVAPGGQADPEVGHGPIIGVLQRHRTFP